MERPVKEQLFRQNNSRVMIDRCVVPTTVAVVAVAEAEVVVVATIAVAVAEIARAARYGAMTAHPCRRRTVARHGDVVPSNSSSVQRDPRKVAQTSPAAEKKRRSRRYIELESVRYVTAEANQIS